MTRIVRWAWIGCSGRSHARRRTKDGDRTPLLGDIPLVGRLFRTNAEQHIKRNLVIFVTARLVNPVGELVNPNEEAEESEDVIEPSILPEVPFSKKWVERSHLVFSSLFAFSASDSTA